MQHNAPPSLTVRLKNLPNSKVAHQPPFSMGELLNFGEVYNENPSKLQCSKPNHLESCFTFSSPLIGTWEFSPPSYGLMSSSSRLDPRLPGRAFEEPLSEALGSGVGAGAGPSQRNGGFQPTMSQLHQRKVWPHRTRGGQNLASKEWPPMIYWVAGNSNVFQNFIPNLGEMIQFD